jgi:glycerol-3-phosphate dehydrogenase
VSIIGGKLTTYRNLAEHAVDKAGDLLGVKLPPSMTARLPLPGGMEKPGPFAQELLRRRPGWLSEQSAGYLVRVYGTRARDIIALARDCPDLREVISPATGAIGATVAFAFTAEHAVTLTDAMMRRSMIGYAADAGFDALDGAVRAARRVTGWDDATAVAELDAHRTYMARFLPKALAGKQ